MMPLPYHGQLMGARVIGFGSNFIPIGTDKHTRQPMGWTLPPMVFVHTVHDDYLAISPELIASRRLPLMNYLLSFDDVLE